VTSVVSALEAAPEAADTLVVVRGDERAYARVPSATAPAIVAQLLAEGREARAVAVREAWTALPARTWTLVGAVLVSGLTAAYLVAPELSVTTAGVAALLLLLADRAMRRPRVAPATDEDTSDLPPRLRRTVSGALADLPSGDARRLVADVVRRARPLLAAVANRPDDRHVQRDVVDLVDACCAIAVELHRVDAFLALPADPHLADARLAESRTRCQETRALLARRLADAVAAIDALHAQLLREGSPASDRVAELASELQAEASARGAATRELYELLEARGRESMVDAAPRTAKTS
jgi:hypothetical protein